MRACWNSGAGRADNVSSSGAAPIFFSFLFPYLVHGCLDSSVLLELADRIKGITHPITGLPIPLSCGLCSRAFLLPGAAADEYLCTVSHVPADLAALSEAAMLVRSRNARRSRVLDCGVVIGVCNSCSIPRRPPRARMSKKLEACASQRHPVGCTSPAKYTPGPGILTYLWPSIQADRERASSPSGRTKVCFGCKKSAERAAKRACIAGQAQTRVPSSTLPSEECGAAAGPSGAMVVGAPSGLHALHMLQPQPCVCRSPPPISAAHLSWLRPRNAPVGSSSARRKFHVGQATRQQRTLRCRKSRAVMRVYRTPTILQEPVPCQGM